MVGVPSPGVLVERVISITAPILVVPLSSTCVSRTPIAAARRRIPGVAEWLPRAGGVVPSFRRTPAPALRLARPFCRLRCHTSHGEPGIVPFKGGLIRDLSDFIQISLEGLYILRGLTYEVALSVISR